LFDKKREEGEGEKEKREERGKTKSRDVVGWVSENFLSERRLASDGRRRRRGGARKTEVTEARSR